LGWLWFAALSTLATYVILQRCIAYEVEYLVARETEDMLNGIVSANAPGKWYISEHAQWECEGFQNYAEASTMA
jgi:hypothetical protein